MTRHTLDAIKGWPSPYAVDFAAKLSVNVPESRRPILSGTVLRLNDAGEYELGTGTRDVMPLFAFNNSDDPDVINEGGDPATEAGVWIAISPTGKMMALPAKGAYELMSTEYIADTYLPNDLLYATDGTGATDGKLRKATKGTHTICGITSRGVRDNGHGQNALAFWPVVILQGT
jgi:hypothetical protein